MYNAGDFNTIETVHIPLNSFSSDDPTASVTMTNLAAGDIEIHKDGSATQRSSDAGVTVTIDFDSVAGNHMINIDLSDNTDAGFYEAGSRYLVRIEGVTVDAGTLNAWVGGFSIGCVLRPTVDGRTLDIQATGEADSNVTMIGGDTQSATDIKDFADAGYDPTTNKVQGVVLVDTTTTNTDMRGTNSAYTGTPPTAAAIVDEWESQSQADPTGFHVNVLEVNGTGQTANDNGADINAILADTNELQSDDIPGTLTIIEGKIDTIDGVVDNILVDTNELQTDWTDGGRLDNLLDGAASAGDPWTTSLPGAYGAGTAGNIVGNSIPAILVDTDEMQGKLPTNYIMGSSDVDNHDTDIDAILADTNELQTDDIPGTLASIDSKIDIIDGVADNIVADTNELQTDWTDGGRLDNLLDGAASAGDPWTTTLPGAYGAGTAGNIVGNSIPAILADTNELQTDDIPGTLTTIDGKIDTIDGIVDNILVDTNELQTDDIPSTLSTIDGKIDTIDGIVDNILTDTAEIGAAGAGLTEAGGTGDQLSAVPWNASWDAEVQSECADALTAYDAATGTDVTTAAANVSVDEIQASALADLFNTDSGTTYAAAVSGSVVSEIADNAGGSGLTAASIADAVWDELVAEHAGVGSAGAALAAAGGSGDPWATALPGVYGAGTAGNIIGSDIASILADTNELQSDDIPTTLSSIDGKIDTIDTIVDSILADTGTDGVMVKDPETGLSFDHAMQAIFALACKMAGGGSTSITARDFADAKDRITWTVDEDGNRTAVTFDFD